MKNSKMCLFQSQNSLAVVLPNLLWRVLITAMNIVLIGGVLFLHACEPTGGTKERNTMSIVKKNTTASVAKPPVDASLPANIKTATFALG
jgi:hypothetical protein